MSTQQWATPRRWHVEETRLLVQRIFGRGQRDLAAPSLRSADDQLFFAAVQYGHFERALKAYLRKQPPDFSVLGVIADDGKQRQAFNVFLLKAGAYVTACIWSMHTMPDTMAHAVYHSLGNLLGPPFAKARGINAATVEKRLRASGIDRLADLLADVKSGGQFAHLDALSNHAKHRSLIRHGLNDKLTGKGRQRFAITLESFVYEERTFPKVDVRKFLPEEYSRLSKAMVAIGNELNAVLRQAATDRGK